MSNALAIASVSFVLVELLNNGLIDRDISASLGDVIVAALPPDKVDARQADGKSRLNLFLYNVTQNSAWRNMGYPSRDANGDRIDNPPLALDLHDLLTAYGAEQFHSEILLGYGMQLLHESPFLPRDAIQKSLSAPTQVVEGGSALPAQLLNLFTSGLSTQVEQIKIWPQTLTTEEISRLWTAFQASDVSPTRIVVQLPPDLSAATQTVQVVQPVTLGSPPTEHNGFSSDQASFVLRPVIQQITVSQGISTITGKMVDLINVTLDPPVGAMQNVLLLLNQTAVYQQPAVCAAVLQLSGRASVFSGEPARRGAGPSATVSVPYSGVMPGTYLVRVQVDGAESQLAQDAHGVFNGPQVAL